MPVVWDLHRWLVGNVWESEDGASRRSLGSRAYYWNHGMCWLDDRRVAVVGIGDDDEDMIAGVVIYDVGRDDTPSAAARPPAEIGSVWPDAREVTAFAGPAGTLFGSGDLLVSASTDGVSLWTVDTGTRIGSIPGFVPRYQDRGAGQLIELNGDHVRTCRYPSSAEAAAMGSTI